jgi:DNA-binding beta-propeller fold protein YncE
MSRTELNVERSSSKIGVFARLRVMHCFLGTGASPKGSACSPRRAVAILPLALAALCAALALVATPASADFLHHGEISGPEPGVHFGPLQPGSVAVDGLNGHVLVAVAGKVYDFASATATTAAVWDGSETPLGSFGASAVSVAAEDSTGDVYVADSEAGVVDKFDAEGKLIDSFGDSKPSPNGQLAGAETPAGGFAAQGVFGIAVDQASGELYVIDAGHQMIDVFDSSGRYLRQIQSGQADEEGLFECGGRVTDAIAVDDGSGGHVFVGAHCANARLFEFTTAGKFVKVITGSETPAGALGGEHAGEGFSVAVNDASGGLFVADVGNSVVDEFNSSGFFTGEQIKGIPTVSNVAWVGGVAVDQATGEVLVAEAASGTVKIFSPPVVLPRVSYGAVSGLSYTGVVLHGSADPHGGGEILECFFEYGETTQYGKRAPCAPAPPYAATTEVSAALSGLLAGTSYHYRMVLSDATDVKYGEAEYGGDQSFTTVPAFAVLATEPASEIGPNGARLNGVLIPESETPAECFFEYGQTGSYGQLAPCEEPDAAEIAAGSSPVEVHADVKGLHDETAYHFRLAAVNVHGITRGSDSSFTSSPAVAGLASEPASEVRPTSARLNGVLTPDDGTPLEQCEFEYGETTGYGNVAPCEHPDLGEIASGTASVHVHADIPIGSATSYHFRLVAANAFGTTPGADRSIVLPSVEADAVHTIDGEGKISVFGMVDPNGADANYRFEFVTEKQFEEGAWADAISTPAQSVSGGGLVAQEIPALQPGATYRFRVTAENTSYPEDPKRSSAKTLDIPAVSAEESPACPNEAERTGPSARLPDCRAYEQITPVNKEGAQDNFDYGNGESTVAGLDGEHLFMTTLSKWGKDVSGNGPTTYSFTRTPEKWAMSTLSPQPRSGGEEIYPTGFYTPDLSQVLVERQWEVSLYAGSPTLEYELGPPGGPYTKVASEPRALVPEEYGRREHHGRWVAQSRNGATAVIETPDHKLIPGHVTGTTSPFEKSEKGEGRDLYEYYSGHLSQVNVNSTGKTIGTCGAQLVQGYEGSGERGNGQGEEESTGSHPSGSINAVSEDGSRVFFEAICPGGGEGGPLYMRVDAAQTVDIGDYNFAGANPKGTMLFLLKQVGNEDEFFSYDTETKVAKRLFSVPLEGAGQLERKTVLSEDGNVFYLQTKAVLTPEAPPGGVPKLYRYDIASESMSFVSTTLQNEGDFNGGYYVTPEGNDYYFNVEGVEGVSGSGSGRVQAYRYDSREDVVQCVSCASPYDPEPRLISSFLSRFGADNDRLAPLQSPGSANGDYVFFDTPSALLPQDINGEIGPSSGSEDFSPSSDVYEWRRDGVDGCGRAQGCIALITDGIDGTENVLLGTDPSGRDVFFATHSQLVPSDKDLSGDVYDARIGGGYPPPPPRPVECEGDACSNPVPPPNDATPSSFTFIGPGDAVSVLPSAGGSTARVVRCSKGRVRVRGRCVKRKPVKRRQRAAAKRGKGSRTGRSAGRRGR